MPSRNIVRIDMPDTYYHVYFRGVDKSEIFRSDEDKDYFLHLLSRYLSKKQIINKKGYGYHHYRGQLELLSYCLMDNHVHFLVYQSQQASLSAFIKSLLTAYVNYFNKRYKRRGPLFESRFKAAVVNRDEYLLHVSRYIHLNPRSWKRYKHSSLHHIAKGTEPEWLQTERVLSLHTSRQAYVNFVADYEKSKKDVDSIKSNLANM